MSLLCFPVSNEWTELNCSGEAAPEELEEHTMVAHEVQTLLYHNTFRVKHVFLNQVNNVDLLRDSCTCLEECWILPTPGAEVPSGCLTSVSLLPLPANLRRVSACSSRVDPRSRVSEILRSHRKSC